LQSVLDKIRIVVVSVDFRSPVTAEPDFHFVATGEQDNPVPVADCLADFLFDCCSDIFCCASCHFVSPVVVVSSF
jgi:hypothetical protein